MAEVVGTRLAVIGGTGAQGSGLARRWATAGLSVVIGSRDADRAAATAADLGSEVSGARNDDAADGADVVLLAVPWAAHAATVTSVAPYTRGKVVIDCASPLGFDEKGALVLPVTEGSAAQQAQRLLPEARVVGAFHHVSAVLLNDPEVTDLGQDVLVVGDDRAATDLVIGLAGLVPGLRGVYAGRLRNSGQVEALAANLIAVNRRYRAHAGVRVTDV